MILPYDPFGKNRMIYTMKTSCVEDSSIPYEDGATTIYLYTKGTEGNPSQELQNMLHYMEQSNLDHVTDNTLKAMHEFVETVKHNKEVMKRYMKSWEYEEMIREEATKEGLAEGRARGRAEGRAEKSFRSIRLRNHR